MSLPTCPKCGSQLEVNLTFASGPRSSASAVSSSNSIGELLDMAEAQNPSGEAADFVATTRERYAQYGDRTRMSEKQMDWLKAIADGEYNKSREESF